MNKIEELRNKIKTEDSEKRNKIEESGNKSKTEEFRNKIRKEKSDQMNKLKERPKLRSKKGRNNWDNSKKERLSKLNNKD